MPLPQGRGSYSSDFNVLSFIQILHILRSLRLYGQPDRADNMVQQSIFGKRLFATAHKTKHTAWSVRTSRSYKSLIPSFRTPHTYLDGAFPFMSWECGLWGPFIARRPCPQRVPMACMGFTLMHCLNIFLSCFGPRAGQALIFCQFARLTLTLL
ncbi:hypothetical protein BD410DRAFT_861124, partial [Rickenella mellea]